METTNTYMNNYNKLSQIANNLESQEVVDIDKILPQIEEATRAYNVCMDRIKQVRDVLNSQKN